MSTSAIVPPCYDDTGAVQDCNGTLWCQDSVGNQGPCAANIQASAAAATGTLSAQGVASGNNPVATSAANNSGGLSLAAIFAQSAAPVAQTAIQAATQPPKTTIVSPLGTFSTSGLTSAIPLIVAALLVFLIFMQTKKSSE
jgi:hypothetical protein